MANGLMDAEAVFVLRDENGAFLIDVRSGKLRTYKTVEQARKYAGKMHDGRGGRINAEAVPASVRRTWGG